MSDLQEVAAALRVALDYDDPKDVLACFLCYLEALAAAKPVGHCWHGHDVEGVVPILVPLDGDGPPERRVALGSSPARLKQECCRCGARRTREFRQRGGPDGPHGSWPRWEETTEHPKRDESCPGRTS